MRIRFLSLVDYEKFDMVWQNNVVFKLDSETIEALIKFNEDILSIAASDGNTNKTWLKKLQMEFEQAAHMFVYHADVRVLEGLEHDGTGELFYSQREN